MPDLEPGKPDWASNSAWDNLSPYERDVIRRWEAQPWHRVRTTLFKNAGWLSAGFTEDPAVLKRTIGITYQAAIAKLRSANQG